MADIGVIGLAVMGKNLILNIADHNFTVAVFNRTVSKVDAFIENEAAGYRQIIGTHSIEELVKALKRPRKILLMVQAGPAVDAFVDKIKPFLDEGDLIIDGGNSNYIDTNRRVKQLAAEKLLFMGVGISGGEDGARNGPSIMPGGAEAGWPLVKDIFQAIAAKTDRGEACCDWVGADGAGHFVKMVHNGIEYGDMQLICEAYQFMRNALQLDYPQMQQTFQRWNQGELDSYLIEITADILGRQDQQGRALVESILDTAGQKGTGKWTGMNALEMGTPLTLIGEAVFARYLSAMKEERVAAAQLLGGDHDQLPAAECGGFIEDLRQALLCSKIVSYAQGYMLMKKAGETYNWKLNYGGIALMWRGGCIIRSVFLGRIKDAFTANPQLQNLMLDRHFQQQLNASLPGWRRVVAKGAELGIPVPAFSSALSFFDGYRSAWLPANLLQAQRDFFGSHTYERTDQPRGQFFHTDWIGSGEEAPA